MQGGTGNDILNGGTFEDVYLFELGDGQDTIVDRGGNDTIRFGEGILPSDVKVSRAGSSLILAHVNGTDRITISDWFNYPYRQIEGIEFDNGMSWSANDLSGLASLIQGTSTSDVLVGTGLTDLIFGG